MSQNKLKVIACLTMLADHIGYLLFPNLLILRYIGRIAMPLFAYFIAEGCLHTRSKLKCFLQVFLMAVFCQLIYFIEDFLNGGIYSISLNILFTFALSILICWSYLAWKGSRDSAPYWRQMLSHLLFYAVIFGAVLCSTRLGEIVGIPIHFDYGIAGILLPLFGVIFSDKPKQLVLFIIGIILFNVYISNQLSYTWFSLLSIPLLLAYNGERGERRMKYAFYLFYPIHFAVIYLVKLILF